MSRISGLLACEECRKPSYHAPLGTMAVYQVGLLFAYDPDCLYQRPDISKGIQGPVHRDLVCLYLLAQMGIRFVPVICPIDNHELKAVTCIRQNIPDTDIDACFQIPNMKDFHK